VQCSYTMTKKISDTQSVQEFINIATQYCRLIESRDKKTALYLFQQAFTILPQLCLYGTRLPEIKRVTEYEPPDMNDAQFIYLSLQKLFKQHDSYRHIFDPYDIKDKKPTVRSISDDFSDIYRDIAPGLKEWEKATTSERRDIIWEWKFSFENHWGDHATSAYNALYSLLYSHIEDESGNYIGIKEKGQ